MKTPYTWRQAAAQSFNADAARRTGVPYRAKRLSVLVDKSPETNVGEMKEWFTENGIQDFLMFAVLIAHPDKVYFKGLSFDFQKNDDAMMFKLRFQ